MPARRRTNSPQIADLRAIGYGYDLPSRLAWRAEQTALTYLRLQSNYFSPTSFPDGFRPDGSRLRSVNSSSRSGSYIAEITESSDAMLVATAASNGRIEVHEMGGVGPSSRLSIQPTQRLSLSSCVWAPANGHDRLLVGYSNLSEVHLYNLETCQENTPCRRFNIGATGGQTALRYAAISDVVQLSEQIFAAASPGRVSLVDMRLRKGKHTFGTIYTQRMEAALTADSHFIYVGDRGYISMYDIRVAKPITSGGVAKNGIPCMGVRERSSELFESRCVDGTGGRFHMIQVPQGAAPGTVAFHAGDGTFGFVDLATTESKKLCKIETDPNPRHNINRPMVSYQSSASSARSTGLQALGTMLESTDMNGSWHVRRRRGAIVTAHYGRGWRAVVPRVKAPGIRVIGIWDDEIHAIDYQAVQRCAAIHPVGGSLEKLIWGGEDASMSYFEVDMQADNPHRKQYL